MDGKIALIFLSSYFVILILLVVAIIWLYNAIKKHNTNHQATLLLTQEQHQRQLLLAKIETQEQAFTHIARELHDNVGQKLSYIKMQLSNATQPITEQVLSSNVHSITDCIDDIRGIARSLNGEYMLSNGLLKSIEDFIENSNRLGHTNSSFVVEGEAIFLQQYAETVLYRIIQESFNNIAKHAKAHTASLRMVFTTEQLQLFIVDDGVGFTPAAHSKTNGLLNIQSRVQLLQGTCHIQSSPGAGTSIHICLPIQPITDAA
jgi:two-component system, NarL family, sensor kinase